MEKHRQRWEMLPRAIINKENCPQFKQIQLLLLFIVDPINLYTDKSSFLFPQVLEILPKVQNHGKFFICNVSISAIRALFLITVTSGIKMKQSREKFHHIKSSLPKKNVSEFAFDCSIYKVLATGKKQHFRHGPPN